ncbi:unnamed protein product [Mytilus edulis]|uniref:Uncharacterized protein n=1 Tax=Mytilus edulis TaxID=6550 RepID=A0A8S3V651_MYTED|nr:unnamed protein product [Mytilus edulis]
MPAPLNSYLLRSQDTIRPRSKGASTSNRDNNFNNINSTASTSTSINRKNTVHPHQQNQLSINCINSINTCSSPSDKRSSVNMWELTSTIMMGNHLHAMVGILYTMDLIQKMCEQQRCNSFPFFMADGIPKQWFTTLSETHNSLQLLKDEFSNALKIKGCSMHLFKGFRGEIGKTVHNTFPKPVTLEQLRAIAENAEKSEQLVPASSITADTIAAILEAKMQEPLEEIRRLYLDQHGKTKPASTTEQTQVQQTKTKLSTRTWLPTTTRFCTATAVHSTTASSV